jgi:hypothetical protein
MLPSYRRKDITTLKKTVVRIPAILLLMILVVVIGNAVYPATKGGWIPAMRQKVFTSFTIPSKPLIDAQQPKQVATATFAMG